MVLGIQTLGISWLRSQESGAYAILPIKPPLFLDFGEATLPHTPRDTDENGGGGGEGRGRHSKQTLYTQTARCSLGG